MTDYTELAKGCGFTVVAPLNPSTLKFLPEVRAMCAADRCQSFNKNWSCPPGCGTIEEWQEKCSHYHSGLLLQTVGDREDSYDIEAMMEAAEAHKNHGDDCIRALRAAGADFLFLSAGTCTRCETCTYPDAPCRFPELLCPSMEACGLFVSQVCTDNSVAYNYGPVKIAYTSCVLFNA